MYVYIYIHVCIHNTVYIYIVYIHMLCNLCCLLSLFILSVTPKIATLLLPLLCTHVLFKLFDRSLLFSTWTPLTFAVILHLFVHYLLCYIESMHMFGVICTLFGNDWKSPMTILYWDYRLLSMFVVQSESIPLWPTTMMCENGNERFTATQEYIVCAVQWPVIHALIQYNTLSLAIAPPSWTQNERWRPFLWV